MIINPNSERPEIIYPTRWIYTVIVSDPVAAEEKISGMLEEYEFEISPSRASRRGKYYSLKISVEVENAETKDRLFSLLEMLEEVLFVL